MMSTWWWLLVVSILTRLLELGTKQEAIGMVADSDTKLQISSADIKLDLCVQYSNSERF
jgi:hypothetical protein